MKKIALAALVIGVSVLAGCCRSKGTCEPIAPACGSVGYAAAPVTYATGGSEIYHESVGQVIAHDASAVYHGAEGAVVGAVHSVENALEQVF